ncbi:hypothetical protein WMY93_006593 [Mugilogobius chulae]|uniref:Uncharacterized protein n=1 Tax=Mugilogobius chulae TaxID=88201 RepID=A0AAW0Q006_9GOBI
MCYCQYGRCSFLPSGVLSQAWTRRARLSLLCVTPGSTTVPRSTPAAGRTSRHTGLRSAHPGWGSPRDPHHNEFPEDPEFREIIRKAERAIEEGIYPERITKDPVAAILSKTHRG